MVSGGGSGDDDAGPDPLASRIALNAAPEVSVTLASNQIGSDGGHAVSTECQPVLFSQ